MNDNIDPKVEYFTMAAWLRGYAAAAEEYKRELIEKLNKAADMLDAVYGKFEEKK